jgi:sugar phosphate isomerase/epimerase
MPISAPNWTMSGFGDEISPDLLVQIAVLQALSINHIEVRSAWNTNIVDLAPEELRRLGNQLRDADLGVSAIASPVGKVSIETPPADEVKRLKAAIVAAHELNARYVRVFSFYSDNGKSPYDNRDAVLLRMAALARTAEEGGVILLHENEKDIYGDTPDRVLDIVESVGSPSLRLAWDAANFVQVGVEPHTEGYSMLRPHLEYLQIKDANASDGSVVPAGKGDGQILTTLQALRDDGFCGYVSLEPHLSSAHQQGGFSGPAAFGVAARALRNLIDATGVTAA